MIAPGGATAVPVPAWRVRDGVYALLVGFVASAIGAAFVASDGLSDRELFAVVLPLQSAGTVVMALFLARNRGGVRKAHALTWRRADLVGVAIGAGIQVVGGAVALTVVETFFDGELPGEAELVTAAERTVGFETGMLVFLGLVVIGPIAEEVVFRGMLLPALLRRGRRLAVVVSSIAFAALHLVDPAAAFSVPFLFVLALVLANERLRTGGLGRPIAIHAGFNLVVVIAVLAA